MFLTTHKDPNQEATVMATMIGWVGEGHLRPRVVASPTVDDARRLQLLLARATSSCCEAGEVHPLLLSTIMTLMSE